MQNRENLWDPEFFEKKYIFVHYAILKWKCIKVYLIKSGIPELSRPD